MSDEAKREWEWVGCMQCGYSGNTCGLRDPYCPNDGSLLLRMPALVVAPRIIEVARALVAYSGAAHEQRLAEQKTGIMRSAVERQFERALEVSS